MSMRNEVYYYSGTDCMGNPYSTWQQYRICSDGRGVIGVGATAEQAVAETDKLVQERETYLAKSDVERLAILLENENLLQTDMNETVHLIGKILLEKYAVVV